MLRNLTRFALAVCLGVSTASFFPISAEAESTQMIEWPQYGGDQHFSRYSPANLINPSNVRGLKILWIRPSIDSSILAEYPDALAGKNFRATPIMVGGVLYSPNGIGLVEAFDAATGETIWVQKPFSHELSEVAGSSTRGVAYWESGDGARIITVRDNYLYSLDASTGEPDPAFGEGGRRSLQREPGVRFHVSGGPLVANGLIIVGGGGGGEFTGDYGLKKEAIPESVRAFDARTGRLVWEFSPIPPVGDAARESWGNGSAEYAGNMGSYGTFSYDEDLGYAYVAFSAPNPPAYGAWRPGDNLYSDSLVAIDVKTGRKVWAQQLVRHDLWEYDLSSPPVLGYSDALGKRVKTVMQTGKNALLFTFNRATGEPIWPIIDTPVSKSTVPGEQASPTQPIPWKPAPLDRVGVTRDDLIDFTPELYREALEIFSKYTPGPLYTPPSLYVEGVNHGTLTLPGMDGGGNWNTGAFDPETGIYYAATMTTVASYAIDKSTDPKSTVDYTMLIRRHDMKKVSGPQGLPLVKPPYGRITAVDMNTGDFRWVTPIGEGPTDHPALKELDLPPMGIPARAGLAITKSLVFAGQSNDSLIQAELQGGYDSKFNAYDKLTGEVLVTIDLPTGSGTGSAPMTYVVDGKQYVVVAIGGLNAEPAWVAMGLEQ